MILKNLHNEVIIGLDLSLRTALSVFKNDVYDSVQSFQVEKPKGNYDPKILINLITKLIEKVSISIKEINPQYIVIEQTNKGRARFPQKILEWIHYEFLKNHYQYLLNNQIYFLDTSEWRRILGIRIEKEIKSYNRKLKIEHESGKINIKHVTINYINEKYGLDLIVKQDDEGDSIALAEAFIKIKNEIGLDKYYQNKELLMKTARREGTQKTRRRRLK